MGQGAGLLGLIGAGGTGEMISDAAIVICVGVLAVYLAWTGIRFIRKTLGGSGVGNVSIVVNVIRALAIMLIVWVVLEFVFDVEMAGIAQALGITTLVVSLGLQDLIKNVVAGMQIVTGKLFSVGSQIESGDRRGEVMDVNWRQTVLRTKDGNIYVVPNASLMSETFMRREGKMVNRYIFDCDIKPGLDLDRVAADIERLADEVLDEKGWRTEDPTEVCFLGSTANGVNASVRIFLKDIGFTTPGTDAVMRAIGQRGYLADWTNESPAQEQWRSAGEPLEAAADQGELAV